MHELGVWFLPNISCFSIYKNNISCSLTFLFLFNFHSWEPQLQILPKIKTVSACTSKLLKVTKIWVVECGMNGPADGSWTPNDNDLRAILDLLHNSQSSDNEVHRQVQQRLQELNNYPDFHNYLGKQIKFSNILSLFSNNSICLARPTAHRIRNDEKFGRPHSQKQHPTVF